MIVSKDHSLSSRDDESSTSLLPSSNVFITDTCHRSQRKYAALLWTLAWAISLIITNLLTTLITHRLTIQSHRSLAEPPNGVANIFRSLHLPPRPTLLNTTFYNPEHSIYRKHASKEAEDAWDRLAPDVDKGVFLVKKEDAVQSGIDPDKHAFFDAEEEGIVGYPVAVEAMHQIHCLVIVHII